MGVFACLGSRASSGVVSSRCYKLVPLVLTVAWAVSAAVCVSAAGAEPGGSPRKLRRLHAARRVVRLSILRRLSQVFWSDGAWSAMQGVTRRASST